MASLSYITGSSNFQYHPQSFEIEVLFPKKFSKDSELYFETYFTTSSIFGCHQAVVDDADYTWDSNDYGNFQIQAVRSSRESGDAFFRLKSINNYLPDLTSSIFKNVYDNEKWNFALKVYPESYPYAPIVSGTSNQDYVYEFVGYNAVSDEIQNSFILTGTIPNASGSNFLTASKRFYIGAHRTNFSGSVLELSDIKASSLRVWASYLTNDELRLHALDSSNDGLNSLYEKQFNSGSNATSSFVGNDIPKIETLLLNWDFSNVSSSGDSSDSLPTTSDATFDVEDVSSGSFTKRNYGWFSEIKDKFYSGQGNFFLPNDSDVVQKEYLTIAKTQLPETINSDSLIKHFSSDPDLIVKRHKKPTSFYFSIEKSMYAIISQSMLKLFSSLREFNDLVGQPSDRYRQNYGLLEHLRDLYFEKVQNDYIDFEKFVEFYKWIDNAIIFLLQQLIPASSDFSEQVQTIIESHILERNKYWNKLPTIEFKSNIPTNGIETINKLFYPWKEGHAPIGLSQEENNFWWKHRAERNQSPLSSGEAGVDNNRSLILSATLSARNRSYFTPIKLEVSKSINVDGYITSSHNINRNKIVSITNVKNENALKYVSASVRDAHVPLGSYREDYDIIQTSDRTTNNRFFVKNDGLSNITTAQSPFIEQVADYSLPDRTVSGSKNKYIFVQRFSAPGGPEINGRGSLDVYAEEYSVYNNMNYRNLIVRRALNSWQQAHADQFGLKAGSSIIGNYHKVNRNTRYKISDSGYSATYDNGFVAFSIPSREIQYSWITSSISKETNIGDQPIGFSSDMTVPFGTGSVTGTKLSFILEGENTGTIKQSFIWNNVLVNNSASFEDQTLYAEINDAIISESESNLLNLTILSRNGPYSYNSWKQIRNNENTIARQMKKNSIVSILLPPSEFSYVTDNGNFVRFFPGKSSQFRRFHDPFISDRFKPLRHTFSLKSSDKPVSMIHTYGNNLSKYSDPELNNICGGFKCQPQLYDQIKKLYLSTDLREVDNPVDEFLSFEYSENIFPKENNAFLIRTRRRQEYKENQPGTSSVVYNFNGQEVQTTQTEYFYASGAYDSNGIDRNVLNRRSFWHSNAVERTRFSPLSYDAKEDLLVSSSMFYSSLMNSQGYKDGRAPSIWAFGKNLNFRQSYVSGVVNTVGTFSNYDKGELDALRATVITKDIGSTGIRHDLAYWINLGDAQYGTGSGAPHYYYNYPTASAYYNELNSTFWSAQNRFLARNAQTEFSLAFFPGPHVWRTEEIAGKPPFYDSYEEFSEDIKSIGKEYSLIPEFNISEHLDFYINEKGGNFREKNRKFLSLIGHFSDVTNSANTENSRSKEKFYKEYSHSDFMKFFDVFIPEHEDANIVPSKISLKCHGIKKLLPYQGFYPCQRTLQLASLFSQSYAPNINGEQWENGRPTDENYPTSGALATQALLQPFFAPGILYNTIKSGIAMDWATMTGSVIDQGGGAAGGGSVRILNEPSYRLPFESLIDLKNGAGFGGVPISSSAGTEKIFWLSPIVQNNIQNDSNAFKEIFFSWNGEEESPLYRMAMHNFLAASIDFFLEDNKLTSIYSKPINKSKKMKNGATYYMDVVLKRSKNILMYGAEFDYTNPFLHSASANATETVPLYGNIPYSATISTSLTPSYAGLGYTGMYFGHPFRWLADDDEKWAVSQPLSSSFGDGYGNTHITMLTNCDMAYAPYLPPYYFDNSVARIAYTADGTEDLSSDLLGKIFSEAVVTNISKDLFSKMMFYNGGSNNVFDMPAWKGRSTVSSSVTLFGIANDRRVTYNTNQTNNSVNDFQYNNATAEDADSSFSRWVISTKFETPILNFINQEQEKIQLVFANGEPTDISVFDNLDTVSASVSGSEFNIAKGMWSGYGEFPDKSEGIYLSIQESFPDLDLSEKNTTGSLIDIFGFDTTPRKLGNVPNIREIAEAIVAIPFLDEPSTSPKYAHTVNVLGRNLFAISKNEFDLQKQSISNGDSAINRGGRHGDIQVEETSISDMIRKMNKFVIPPEINFNLYNDIPPFVMYMFEFKSSLSRQDLADIWQGVMPSIAMTAEKESTEIAHSLEKWEFFEGKKIPSGIRWIVFKVKQKAPFNYFEKTADSRDDSRFKFDFQTQENVVPDYSFNYPYDFCSLVELAKVESTITLQPKKIPQESNEKTFSSDPGELDEKDPISKKEIEELKQKLGNAELPKPLKERLSVENKKIKDIIGKVR